MDTKLITELRNRTGAGVMDCKSALAETQDDIEAAIVLLRKKSIIVGENKVARQTNQGRVFIDVTDSCAAIMTMECETDFLANTEEFIALGQNYITLKRGLHQLHEFDPENEIKALDDDLKVLDAKFNEDLSALRSKSGETINLSFPTIIHAAPDVELFGTYLHSNHKIGVIVKVNCQVTDSNKDLINNIAMHIAATSPRYISKSWVDKEVIDGELEIARDKAAKTGKPLKVQEAMVNGALNKFYGEVCLLEQKYIKDTSKTIEEIIDDDFHIVTYERYAI